jgi:hypothetical protein
MPIAGLDLGAAFAARSNRKITGRVAHAAAAFGHVRALLHAAVPAGKARYYSMIQVHFVKGKWGKENLGIQVRLGRQVG